MKKGCICQIKVTATKNLVSEVSLVLRWARSPLTVFLWKIQIRSFQWFDVLVWNAPVDAGTRWLLGDLPTPHWECGTSWTWPAMTERHCCAGTLSLVSPLLHPVLTAGPSQVLLAIHWWFLPTQTYPAKLQTLCSLPSGNMEMVLNANALHFSF